MDWDKLMNVMGNAVERKMDHLEGSLKSKARGYSDSQLERMYNSGNLAPMAQDVVEAEMRRRGLL